MLNRLILISSLILLAAGRPSAQDIKDGPHIVETGGQTRLFYLHLPGNLPDNAPLVFALHGYGGSAHDMISFSGMNKIADENGFAVCYPQGITGQDNKNSWNAGYSNPEVDDVKFLTSLAKKLQKEFRLSSRNTFCTGMSNGADMCYVLACQSSGVFSAVAPVAGCMMESTLRSCKPGNAIPVFEIHGTNDSITLWDGDADYSGEYGGYISTRATIAYWIKENRCTGSEIDTLPDFNKIDDSYVVSEKYRGGVKRNVVWLYRIEGGKHDWPGNWGNKDIIAGEEIWKFFRQFIR